MSWARLDDTFHTHPKAMNAWTVDRASLGLHTLALSWCACHEQDGKVPASMVTLWLPDAKEREEAVDALVAAGMWHENGKGYVIHDFLDYNPSRADLTARRETDRRRKSESAGKAGARG